jgi:hypothetical protein
MRNLDARVKDAKVLLGNAFLFFAQEENALSREFEIVEHLAVGCLLQSKNLIAV